MLKTIDPTTTSINSTGSEATSAETRPGSIRRRMRRIGAMAALAALPASFALSSSSAGAQNVPTAPCRTQSTAGLIYIGNNTLTSCAIIVRAAAFGNRPSVGTWGNNVIAMDVNSTLYVRQANGWGALGTVRNANGTVGSLSDRCSRGDVGACNTWRANSAAAIESLNRLYPTNR